MKDSYDPILLEPQDKINRQLLKRIIALEEAVNDSETRIEALEEAVNDSETRIEALEEAVNDSETGNGSENP